jgi:hypothetical protein
VLEQCHQAARDSMPVDPKMLTLAIEVTDCNAAVFDTANGFAGSTAGIHEILRRQGLLEGTWCLSSERSELSPGQASELDRVHAAYPHLVDDDFVEANRDRWLNG